MTLVTGEDLCKMFDICLFLAEQLNDQRAQAAAVATKLARTCKNQKLALQENQTLIEELRGAARLMDDETFNNEETMKTNARLVATNHEQEEEIRGLREQLNTVLAELDQTTDTAESLRVSVKTAELQAETNKMGARLLI